MAIKLNITKPKSAEVLRQEYVESKKEATKVLENRLRELIDSHRVQYQQYIANGIYSQVQQFVDNRKEGQDLRDYYEDRFGRYSVSIGIMIQDRLPALNKLTDYAEQIKSRGYGKRQDGTYGPLEFKVTMKKNAKAEAFKLAEKEVEYTVQTFLYRAKDKMVDLMVAVPNPSITLEKGSFSGGVFQGQLKLEFHNDADKSVKKFYLRMSLKYNRSVLGTPFVQYPFTLHDYQEGVWDSYKDGGAGFKFGKTEKLAEKELPKKFGYTKWMPVVQKKNRFSKVSSGSVILTQNKYAVVLRTSGDTATVLMAGNGTEKVKVPASKIDGIAAQIEVRLGIWKNDNDFAYVTFQEGFEKIDMGKASDADKVKEQERKYIALFNVLTRLIAEKKLTA